MSEETIFVSIASYQDDMLKLTIADALAKAKHPDRIKFGVVEQREAARRINPGVNARKQIRYVGVEPEDSRGVCWARSVCMSLYQNEDWYFQIDSHMLFDQHWDEWYINQCKQLETICEKPIISGYPKSFWLEKNFPNRETEPGARVHLIPQDAKFADNALIIFINAQLLKINQPVKAWHVAAGCLFARGNFVNEIPYDPQIYFEGEEQTLGLRSFTNGWDVFHVPDMPLFHYWARDTRTSHWECKSDKKRHENWASLKLNSLARVREVLSGKQQGIYGIGCKRTLQEYAEFCGVDYQKETINPEVFLNTIPKE
jgi:hypothetical protein